MTDYHHHRLYNHRSYYYRSVVLLLRTNTENIITNINYYVLFVSRTALLPIRYITNMYTLPNWLSPNCTITEHSYHRIVVSPNVTITERFYYGLLLPNVAHSTNSPHYLKDEGYEGYRYALVNLKGLKPRNVKMDNFELSM